MVSIDKLVLDQKIWVSESGIITDYCIRFFSHINNGKAACWNNAHTSSYFNNDRHYTTPWGYISLTDPNIKPIEVWFQ